MKKIYLTLPVIAGVMWGSSGIFVRTLTAFGMQPETLMFTRVLFGTLLLGAGMFIYDRNLLKVKFKDLGLMFGCGLTGMLGLNICYIRAIEDLSLSLAAVLLSLCPVFVIFMAAVLFKEKITRKKILCTVMALAGCFLVSGIMEADGLSWTWTGIFLGLGSAVFYAMYSIISKITMERGYSVFTIIFYSVLMVLIILAPFADYEMVGSYMGEKTVLRILFLTAYALCTSILPYIIFSYAMQHAETGKVSILASGGEPTAAAIFGMMFFAEIPSVLTVAGLVITIAALAVLCYEEERPADSGA